MSFKARQRIPTWLGAGRVRQLPFVGDTVEPSISILVHPMHAIRSTCLAIAVPLTLAACGTSRPHYVKQEASEADVQTSMSECEYQIKLNKTPKSEQDDLRNLCMQGKGFRSGK